MTGGWDLKAVCINGVLEETWRLQVLTESAKYYEAYQRIAELLNIPRGKCVTTINAQSFYDDIGKLEAIYMYVDVWKLNASKPDTYWITPKDRIADRTLFEAGQKLARDVLEILSAYGVKQDKKSLIEKLQRCRNEGLFL